MKELLFSRTLKNRCPICNKEVDKEYIVVNYNEAKLTICKKHIKYKVKK